MSMYYNAPRSDELYHYGVMGMKWGVRRYQNPDGTLTSTGRKRYNMGEKTNPQSGTSESKRSKKNGLTKNQKTALKIGAAVVGTGLAVYGGYKVSKAIKAYKVDKAKWAETRKIVDEYKELKRFNLGGMAMRDADERIARAGLKALSKR